jgi:serine/threonine protein kinase
MGSGTFSRVYRVEREGSTGFAKELALKVLAPGVAPSEDLRRMFVEEAQVACHLHHRNIVSVHEFGVLGDQYFLVMDCVEGLDLRQLLRALRERRAWIPMSAALELAIQVLHGLHHAHTRRDARGNALGIVHRDINPANVLISVEGGVKITDFGLARIRSGFARTEGGFTRGTARYMSPEQARGRPLDARSDLFAVGILLYLMLAGALPFTGEDDAAAMRAVVRCEYAPVESLRAQIPAGLAEAVRTLMAPEPQGRPADALEAAELLAAAAEPAWVGQPERSLAGLVRREKAAAQAAAAAASSRPAAVQGPDSETESRVDDDRDETEQQG